MTTQVKAYCPWCGHRGLFVGVEGHLTCPAVECRRPTAADELLDDQEIAHVVTLGDTEFTIRHPLHERLDDRLMECDLHRYLADLSGPPWAPGRYRVQRAQSTDQWRWNRLEGAS